MCITGVPICGLAGAGLPSCGTGPDCSVSGESLVTDPLTNIASITVLPGAQDRCTCAAGALQACNRPQCLTATAAPTCPSNGADAICANYDSATTVSMKY